MSPGEAEPGHCSVALSRGPDSPGIKRLDSTGHRATAGRSGVAQYHGFDMKNLPAKRQIPVIPVPNFRFQLKYGEVWWKYILKLDGERWREPYKYPCLWHYVDLNAIPTGFESWNCSRGAAVQTNDIWWYLDNFRYQIISDDRKGWTIFKAGVRAPTAEVWILGQRPLHRAKSVLGTTLPRPGHLEFQLFIPRVSACFSKDFI
jgi:hypothetical protein